MKEQLTAVIVLGFILLYLWPFLALQAKRWHDRDKSAWWILLTFIPFIGWVWVLFELGGMKGTVGENRFGTDPKVIVSSGSIGTPSTAQSTTNLKPEPSSPESHKLREARQLVEQGLINEDEYSSLKHKILSEKRAV